MKLIFCVLLFLFASVQCFKESEIHEFVDKFDSFNFAQTHVKRSSVDNFEFNVQIEGRDFTLILQNNFELTQHITLTTPRMFMKGTVKGFPESIVRLSMEDSFVEGIIIIDGESIYVENIEVNGEGHNTVAYKSSNVKRDSSESLKARCKQLDAIVVEKDSVTAVPISSDFASSNYKRADTKDCKMALVADIKFYNKYGANSQSTMISTLNSIEALYLAQVNTGLPVVYTYVVTSTSDSTGLGNPSTSIDTLLTSFRTLVNNKSLPNFPTGVCLFHLFTYQDFRGTLGLAYVGSTKTNTIGGICSPQGVNTGVTTFLSGTRESSVLVRTVTAAHEIGHNFGSKHDTEHDSPPGNLPECNPTDKFMMYPSVNTGNNAQKFSTCSLYSVTETIKVKSTCFTLRTSGPTAAPTNAPTSGPTAAPTNAPTSGPTNAPTNAPTNVPTNAPTNAPTNVPTSAPTASPTTSTDQCATDTRLGASYVACSFQPSGFSPCVLFCAEPGATNQCFYFTLSSGAYLNKNAGSSCGTGMVCTSTGTCVSGTATTAPTAAPTVAPTRAPTLPPTTAPTTTAAPSTSPTTSPQPQCPSWAPTTCSTNDCQLRCKYSSYCFLQANRPDGTVCGGTGRCVSGTCRPASAGMESTECDPTDACCDSNGNLRPLGYVCRAAENPCDIMEVCDPQSPRPSLCPDDEVRPGGTPCNCSDSDDPSTCADSCGSGDFNGVCGKPSIESCQGNQCGDGFECKLLKGVAKCVPAAIATCENNCGKSASSTVGCFCDESCVETGDCCSDYQDFCVTTKGGSLTKSTPGWVWGIVGAVIALVVIGAVAGIGFFFYTKNKRSIKSTSQVQLQESNNKY